MLYPYSGGDVSLQVILNFRNQFVTFQGLGWNEEGWRLVVCDKQPFDGSCAALLDASSTCKRMRCLGNPNGLDVVCFSGSAAGVSCSNFNFIHFVLNDPAGAAEQVEVISNTLFREHGLVVIHLHLPGCYVHQGYQNSACRVHPKVHFVFLKGNLVVLLFTVKKQDFQLLLVEPERPARNTRHGKKQERGRGHLVVEALGAGC